MKRAVGHALMACLNTASLYGRAAVWCLYILHAYLVHLTADAQRWVERRFLDA